MAEFYDPAAEDAGMGLDVHVSPDLTVAGEANLLRTMIANLLDNALKYGRGGHDCVALSLTREGSEALLVVRDYGPGVAEDDRSRLTERFVRGDTARSKPGAGLGLSMVKAVVGQHGGRMALTDAAPGLAVRISLPLVS